MSNANKNRTCWVTMGDWGANYTGYQVPVAARMDLVCTMQQIHCVLCTGDNFYEHGVFGMPPDEYCDATDVPGEGREQREQRIHVMSIAKKNKWITDSKWIGTYFDVYRRPEFKVLSKTPFVLALGNHDYYGLPDAQVAFTYVDPKKLWHMPMNYFTYDIPSPSTPGGKPVRVVVIDTVILCRKGRERKTHKAWILDTLRTARKEAGCILVMGHYPVHSEGSHCARELNANANNGISENGNNNLAYNNNNDSLERSVSSVSKPNTIKRWLIEAMLQNRVDLYVCGHNHNLEYCAIRDRSSRVIHCITSGAAAKLSKPPSPNSCTFSLSSMYNLLSGGIANGGGAEGDGSFVNPIFGYGFVEHEYDGQAIINRFHYVIPGNRHNGILNANKPMAWKTAVVKIAVNSK